MESFCELVKLETVIWMLLHIIATVAQDTYQELSNTDTGTCNTTSTGEGYMNGYYGLTIIRPIPIHNGMVGTTFYCTYSFQGMRGQRVLIQVTKLIAGQYDSHSRSCLGGYLRLWDGVRQPGRYRYPPNTLCGTYNEGKVNVHKFSTDLHAEVEFYVQQAMHHNTFTIEFKYVNIALESKTYPKQIWHHMKLVENSASVCSWQLYVEDCDGVCPLLSPGYPGVYPPGMECFYHVTSLDPNVAIQLLFSGEQAGKPREFDLMDSSSCREDYLEIYDGSEASSEKRVGRFCGRTVPPRVTLTGPHAFLAFVSAPDTPPYGHAGFHASAVALTQEWQKDGSRVAGTFCDWAYNATEGSVSSPDHWLPRRAKCEYRFHVASGHLLKLILHIYGLGPSCKDRVDVYEGTKLIARLCDNNLYETQRFTYNLSSSEVTVKYIMYSGQVEPHPDIGFWLSFKQLEAPQNFQPDTPDVDKQQRVSVVSSCIVTSQNFTLLILTLVLTIILLEAH